MVKMRVYLDTSVISHLLHEDAPEKMRDTLSFWREIATGKYDAIISDVTMLELKRCEEPKRGKLFNYLEEIRYILLPQTDEAELLALAYIEGGILTLKNKNDCLHIALAVIGGCDVIVSWNFKYMVRIKTIQGIRPINVERGYFKNLDIVTPAVMLGEESVQ